jgi:tetratricopeptide (TPR) repeat protein
MKSTKITILLVLSAVFVLNLSQCEPPEITSAKVYLQQNNPKAAEEQLLQALEKYPDNAQAAFLLATNIYRPQKQYEKARDMLVKARALDPNLAKDVDLMIRGIWAEIHTSGATQFNDALRAFLPSDKDSLLKVAAKQFEYALQFNDTAKITYNGLIKSYYLLNDTAHVVKFAQEMFAKNIADPEVMKYYYEFRWTQGKEAETLAELEKAIKQFPTAYNLQILYITYLAQVEQYQEAINVCKKILEKDPQNLDVVYILAQIYTKVNNFEEAKYLYQKVLAENPNDLELLTRAAENIFNSKDWVTAEDYARHIIELDPESAFGYEVLWKSLYNQGKREEAEKYREIAKSLR